MIILWREDFLNSKDPCVSIYWASVACFEIWPYMDQIKNLQRVPFSLQNGLCANEWMYLPELLFTLGFCCCVTAGLPKSIRAQPRWPFQFCVMYLIYVDFETARPVVVPSIHVQILGNVQPNIYVSTSVQLNYFIKFNW